MLVTEGSLEAVNRAWAPLRSRGELPHLYKPGGTYFVTFRLWNVIAPPASRRSEAKSPADLKDPPQDVDSVAARSEPPLTAGSCVLRRPEVASIVTHALQHFDGERYVLHAWCVMPNHVHVVVTPMGENRLSSVLHSWKSFSAKQINKHLGR